MKILLLDGESREGSGRELRPVGHPRNDLALVFDRGWTVLGPSVPRGVPLHGPGSAGVASRRRGRVGRRRGVRRWCVPGVGGLLAGDRLAVVKGQPIDGEMTAKKVINLTTLQGKWTSIDKNFEILEGGEVKSNVEAEKNPWTSWKILNGKLLLNRDTFEIDNIGSDSLELENRNGIFLYKRAK